MIDVGIGTGEAPLLGIGREGSFHILVNEHLQIDVGLAEGADDDVGADAPI